METFISDSSNSEGERRTMENVEKTRAYQCSICEKLFNDESEMKKHQRFHPQHRRHQCSICSRRFLTFQQLEKHKQIHLALLNKCKSCLKTLQSKAHLDAHKCYGIRAKLHKCSKCSRRFMKYSDMCKHQKVHQQRVSYECKVCHKCFMYRSAYLQHRQVHNVDKEASGDDMAHMSTNDMAHMSTNDMAHMSTEDMAHMSISNILAQIDTPKPQGKGHIMLTL